MYPTHTDFEASLPLWTLTPCLCFAFQELSFGDGYIISDCNDIEALVSFRVARNMSHAAAKGIRGGVDLDLQCGSSAVYTQLPEAISNGMVDIASVTKAARRVLMAKYALGLFEAPMVDPESHLKVVNSPEHRELALRAAEGGIVMLKNGEGVDGSPLLPLRGQGQQIAQGLYYLLALGFDT